MVARSLGGEVGKGVLVAMWLSRIFKAVIRMAEMSERSYWEKSRLDFKVFLYRWLRSSISFISFIGIAWWKAEVRCTIGWSVGGRGRLKVVVGVEELLLMSRSAFRLRM